MANPLQPPQLTNNLVPPPPLNPAEMSALMPPPSPSLGFQHWASDPRNAMKVQPAMVAPDAPLQPNAGKPMASAAPPNFTPPADTSAPTMGVFKAPTVQGPTQLDKDQAELQRLQQSGAAVNHVQNPVLRTLGKVGDIASMFLLGRGAAAIPGTTAHNLWLQDQAQGRVNNDVSAINQIYQQQQNEAALANTKADTAAKQLVTISADEAARLGNPSLEGQQVTQQAFQHILTNANTNQTRLQTNQLTNQTKKDIATAQALTKEKLASLKPEQRDDKAIRLMQIPAEQRTPADNSYLAAYSRWVDQTKTQPGVARAQAFAMFRPVKTIDDDGNEHYQYAGEAIKSGANTSGSMNFKTAAAMAKFMTSGKGGNTMTAYRTATDHLDLLGKAADALGNGDVQGMNQLSNAFKEQFGSAAPTNFNSVKAMLSGELANVAKVTGATDQEIATAKEQINRAASPDQLRGVIETNQDLMDQKAKEMFEQYQSGMQGRPDFSRGGMNPARRTPVGGNPLKPPTPKGGSVIVVSPEDMK